MIQLKNISLNADNFTLSDISLDIQKGSFNVLLGPTGSGKTLVLELIAGLRKAESGSVFINSKDVQKLPPEERGIAYVPQDIALFPHLNVYDNIVYGLKINRQSINEETFNKLSKTLDIVHLLKRDISGLSGGEKQRVALARALAVQKKVLLLDEPTAAIHESMQENLCLFIRKIQQEFKLTVLMTTHHKDSAFLLADYLHFIDKGKLLISASKEQFKQQPIPANAAGYFGVNNILRVKLAQKRNEKNEYWCEELKTTFVFGFGEGLEDLKIGFKSSAIQLLGKQEENQSNRFQSVVKNIFRRENNVGVLLHPVNLDFPLTMDISVHVFRKSGISEGSIVWCRVDEEDFQVIQ